MSLFPLGLISQGGGAGGGVEAFELISTQVLGSDSSTITFSSIPTTTYKHLQLRITGRQTGGDFSWVWLWLRANSDSASNYYTHWLIGQGGGSLVTGGGNSSQMFLGRVPNGGNASGNFGAAIIDIPDAFDTTKYKTFKSISGQTSSDYNVGLYSGVWQSTAAITSLSVVPQAPGYATGSRFSLYGVKG